MTVLKILKLKGLVWKTGADLGGGCRGCAPPPPQDDLRFSNTTGILKKKTMWFIGVEVEQETSAPPPKKNPGSAPGKPCMRDWIAKVVFLIQMLPTFGDHCNHYF